MNLSSFKELLLKKTDDDSLANVIASFPEEVLAEVTLEILEKAKAGTSVNPAIFNAAGDTFGSSIPKDESPDQHHHENFDAAMIRDNLGHHLTRYKAALQAGDRKTADQHLSNAMQTMAYATKLEHPSNGSIRLRSGVTSSTDPSLAIRNPGEEGTSLIAPHAWEQNYTGSHKKDGQTVNSLVSKGWSTRTGSSNSTIPDYQYLESTPHQDYGKAKVGSKTKGTKDSTTKLFSYENAAYPFHELQVNGRYVDIKDDHPHSGKFEPHTMDTHPARGHAYSESSLAPQLAKQANEKYKAWLNSPELDKWLEQKEASHSDAHGLHPSKPILDNPNPSFQEQHSSKFSDSKEKHYQEHLARIGGRRVLNQNAADYQDFHSKAGEAHKSYDDLSREMTPTSGGSTSDISEDDMKALREAGLLPQEETEPATSDMTENDKKMLKELGLI